MTQQFAPLGHNRVSPYLLVASVRDTLEFTSKTFHAVEIRRVDGEGGAIKHAEVRIGDSVVMMGERGSASIPGSIHVYVASVDDTY